MRRCMLCGGGRIDDPFPFDGEENDPEKHAQTGARKNSADGAAPRCGWEQTMLQKTAGLSWTSVCARPPPCPAQVLDAFRHTTSVPSEFPRLRVRRVASNPLIDVLHLPGRFLGGERIWIATLTVQRRIRRPHGVLLRFGHHSHGAHSPKPRETFRSRAPSAA
jgi:hypothetical protein